MTSPTPSIKEEFEKAHIEAGGSWRGMSDAKRGAKWMAERCAEVANNYMASAVDPATAAASSVIKIKIRQLAKELDQ